MKIRWDAGGNGPGSSFRVQRAGIHKAALDDYTVAGSTTVGLIWTGGLNDQMYKMGVLMSKLLLVLGYS